MICLTDPESSEKIYEILLNNGIDYEKGTGMDCLTEKTIDDMLCGHVDQSSRAYKGLRMAFLFIKEHGADEFERLAHFLEKSPLPNLSLKQFQEILSKSFNTYLTEKNIDDSFHGLIDQSTVRYKLIKEMVYYGYRQGILLEGYEKYSDIDDLLNKTLNPEEFSESPLPNLSWEQFKQILGENDIDLNNPEDVATLILTEESIDVIFNGYTEDQSAVYYKYSGINSCTLQNFIVQVVK